MEKGSWRQISPKNQIFIRIKPRERSNLRIRQIVIRVKLPRASNRKPRQAVAHVKFSGAQSRNDRAHRTGKHSSTALSSPSSLTHAALQPS